MRIQNYRDGKSRSLPQRITGLAKKFKNKQRYKNAAYYTLSSDSYSPTVSGLFLCFRASGLGICDSFFNAIYMYAAEKNRVSESRLKRRYGDVVPHPHGYDTAYLRSTFWSLLLRTLDFVPKIFSLPSRISAARRRSKAQGENSIKKFVRIAALCRRRASYILPTVMAIVVGVCIYNASNAKVVLEVSYDGVNIGTVENSRVINDALEAVEETLSESSGVSVKLSGNVTYSAKLTSSPKYVASSRLYSEILTEAKKDYTTAYGLYIDGTLIAPLENKSDIETVLTEITGEASGIANGIQILKQDYPQDAIKSGEELKEILAPTDGTVIMSTELVAVADNAEAPTVIRSIPTPVNTDSVDFSNAYAIDDAEKTLELNYRTEKYEKKTVTEEYMTVYEYDSNMYTTSKYVKQQGRDGTKTVTEKIVYVNGEEESRTVVSEEVIKETVNKIVVKGLKPVPESGSDEATESFYIWPYEGNIDEDFGWRNRDGYSEYHAGIDMRAPRGTPILAAATGVVESAGDFHNGYGKMVILHHADGKQTVYAHMNDIYVTKGDLVTQGTIIGEIGSTGDSTGNHLHFEVRVNGTATNPLIYLVSKGD